MSACLIVCYGYFGDHLFANSIAERLIEENQFDVVDYVIGWPQLMPFFERNPYIRNVICESIGPAPQRINNWREYNRCFQLGPIHRELPPAVEMQLACGVKHPSPEFFINTNPECDIQAKDQRDMVRSLSSAPILAIMNGWKEKSFLFTEDQYRKAVDVPQLGYGGSHRNTDYIIEQLSHRYPIVMVGAPANVSQTNINYDGPSLDMTASMIKYCDFFIGAEGGMANFAYAVGTKTILTSDFVHQLYGPEGVLQQLNEPKLGPWYYDKDPNRHINLDPYLTDEEVLQTIYNHIN